MQILQYHFTQRVVRVETLFPFVWHITDAPNVDVGNMVMVNESIFRVERIQPEDMGEGEDDVPLVWTFGAMKVAEVAVTLVK